MLYANPHMQQHYFDNLAGGPNINEFFTFPMGMSYDVIKQRLKTVSTWTGRVTTVQNHYGISSVELMLHVDAADASKVWLYTLEHPVVDGRLRFSSRSEMQMLQVLLDNTLEYVFIRDCEGRFIITNKAFMSAIEVEGAFVSPIGETIATFASEESVEWFEQIDQRVTESGKASVNNITHLIFKNGTRHWIQMTTVPVLNADGDMVGSVSVARDITELKRAEADLRAAIKDARDASRAKGQFLAAMSHEIRTPINGIIGASELCSDTDLNEEQRGYLDTSIKCSNTLLALVNDVLDFSKIEAGQMHLEKLNFSIITLMEDVAAEFTQIVRQKGVELVVGYDAALPKFIMGDPTRLKQVFYNLIGNAVKFTEQGEITLHADTLYCDKTRADIRFTVTDTGVGISKDRQQAVFSSFTQEDMATTRKYGGSGLGLTICKDLVELMQGRIELSSSLGVGSTFTIDLSFDLSTFQGADLVSSFSPELAGLRVLIVDDIDTNRDIYSRMCASWGYRSSTAKNGLDALTQLELASRGDDPFRLVMLDQQMPGLTGLDLASLIKNRPDLRNSQILLLSSYLERDGYERAGELGIARVLTKPVKRSTILEVILEIFQAGAGTAKVPLDKPTPHARQNLEDKSLNVLLAEDNEVNQQVAMRRLQKLGHRVTIVANGFEALNQLKEHVYDCVLMDIQMPIMDGYEATRRIREHEAKQGGRTNYIVAMTAHAMKGDKERCLDKGMDNYLSKPFRAEGLRAVLDAAVAHAADKLTQFSIEPEGSQGFDEHLSELNGEEKEDVLAVGRVFLNNLPYELRIFRNALETKQVDAVSHFAHAMKGATGIFGCQKCLELCELLEGACLAIDLDKMQHYGREVITQIEALALAIEAALSTARY